MWILKKRVLSDALNVGKEFLDCCMQVCWESWGVVMYSVRWETLMLDTWPTWEQTYSLLMHYSRADYLTVTKFLKSNQWRFCFWCRSLSLASKRSKHFDSCLGMPQGWVCPPEGTIWRHCKYPGAGISPALIQRTPFWRGTWATPALSLFDLTGLYCGYKIRRGISISEQLSLEQQGEVAKGNVDKDKHQS